MSEESRRPSTGSTVLSCSFPLYPFSPSLRDGWRDDVQEVEVEDDVLLLIRRHAVETFAKDNFAKLLPAFVRPPKGIADLSPMVLHRTAFRNVTCLRIDLPQCHLRQNGSHQRPPRVSQHLKEKSPVNDFSPIGIS